MFRTFRVISLGSAALALGAACAIACSSSTSTPAPPLSGDDDASTVDGAAGTAGNPIGASEPDSGQGDDGSASDDGATTGCPSINGTYSLMTGASGSSSECPTASDVCTFATDISTCKFTGICASSGMAFNTTIDSSGKVAYTESFDAGAALGSISGACSLQFSSDKTMLAATCSFDSIVTCNGSGAYLGDAGVVADASTD